MKEYRPWTPFETELFNSVQNIVVGECNEGINITSVLFLPPSMLAFDGHFPGKPIFPAVMQLVLVRLLCSEAIKVDLHNVSVGKTKFSSIIGPEEEVEIVIELLKKKDKYNAKFKFANGDNIASSGTVRYKTVN